MTREELEQIQQRNREFLNRIRHVSRLANDLFEKRNVPHFKYCPMLFQASLNEDIQSIQVLMVPDAEFWRSRLESFHLGIIGELFDCRLFEVWELLENLK